MRTVVIVILLVGAAITTWLLLAKPEEKKEAPKTEAINVSPHPQLTAEVAALLKDYYQVGEAFVNWDSAAAASNAASLAKSAERISFSELKDSAIILTAKSFVDNISANAATIAEEKNIRPQREAYQQLTDNLYQLLNTIQYNRQALYLQECPMAFDDTETAQWISEEPEIRNPYLGLYHPEYGKGMLKCGETKTVMNKELVPEKPEGE